MSDINNQQRTTEPTAPQGTTPEHRKTAKPKKKMTGRRWKIFFLNLLAMMIVGMVLIWLVMGWLGSYTRHNNVVEIPNIIGTNTEDAEALLAKEHLNFLVTDSIYDETKAPGEIVETVPAVGSSIKRDRTIFVKINAHAVKKRQIPDVHEKSMRQAQALLEATGFSNVIIKYVPGTYNDLALYVKTISGRVLNPGDLVPYNQALVLEVSSNDPDLLLADSLDIDTPQLSTPTPIDTTSHDEKKEEGWF